MRYRTRLVLLVTGLLACTVIAISAPLAWSTRNALLASAEESGQIVANLLARSAGLANEIPREVEDMLGAQMVAQAQIVAHFVDAAEKAGFTPEEINRRFRQISDTTVLSEFWVTDEKGHAYLRNMGDFDFTFSPSAIEQPQAYVFWPLLSGQKDQVIQEARKREIDDQHTKYAAVKGVDKPRIVQVGHRPKYLEDLKARVGLGRAVQALLASGDIDAIWVFDTKLGQLAGPEVTGPASASVPSELEMQSIRNSLQDQRTRSVLLSDALSVIAPIKTEGQNVSGAALVRISTDRMWQAVWHQIRIAAFIALFVLLAGFGLSYLLAKYQVAPIEQLTLAATAIEQRKFDARSLDKVAARPDELGRLARVFTGMGETVLAREEKLDTLVQERTRALSERLEDLRAAQDRLVQTEKLASLGQLTAGIAHEIKNPLNFVNNFSALSAELVGELDETLAPAPLDQRMRGDVSELTQILKGNLEKVVEHGKRADSIVKNMLLHSREGSGEHRSTDINALVEESLKLAYHGARAEKSDFNIALKHDLDPDAGELDLYPQEITRALLNLISNGFYAATKRKEAGVEGFEPTLSASTKNFGKSMEIRIRDNGAGIPAEVKENMFNPFFTTKPPGEGTGLGLSMSHDIIVKQHGGRIEVETEPGGFTEFIITLPRNGQNASEPKPDDR